MLQLTKILIQLKWQLQNKKNFQIEKHFEVTTRFINTGISHNVFSVLEMMKLRQIDVFQQHQFGNNNKSRRQLCQ